MYEVYRKNEYETNEVVAGTILLLSGFVLIIGVLCWTKIFNISDYLINSFILAVIVPLLLPVIIVNVLHISRKWVKYILIACVVVTTGIAYVFFTFQTVIIFIVPLIIAVFYLDKKVLLFTGGLSVMNIFIVHFITGFYLFQPWIEPFQGIKAVLLYGALPRILQCLFCIVLLYILCGRVLSFFQGFGNVIYEKQEETHPADSVNSSELSNILMKLTEREQEVFALLVQGYTNTQIAARLCLSVGTVKNYVSGIYDKIEMKDRTTLVLKYSLFYRDYDHSHD